MFVRGNFYYIDQNIATFSLFFDCFLTYAFFFNEHELWNEFSARLRNLEAKQASMLHSDYNREKNMKGKTRK